MPQTLGAYVDATTLEGAKQTIAVGPVASQVAIKMLGTNGGGFFNANAAHRLGGRNFRGRRRRDVDRAWRAAEPAAAGQHGRQGSRYGQPRQPEIRSS